jgi:hypothetical protein
MFTTITKPYRPWSALWGLGIVAGALLLVFVIQVYWPQFMELQPPILDVAALQMTRLVSPPNVIPARSPSQKKAKEAAAEDTENTTQSTKVSVVPGTPQWRQHVERGRGLGLDIVAEQSLAVLRAYGVLIALDIRRPRGNVLLYNLQNHSLGRGVVAPDAVCRELEGLPAEFEAPLREAERELGGRPSAWALYSPDLFAALRSMTEDALEREAVPIESVKTARVRLSVVGGGAFAVKLVSHL